VYLLPPSRVSPTNATKRATAHDASGTRDGESLTFQFGPNDQSDLDKFLLGRIPNWSRRRVRASIAAGEVEVNGKRARIGRRLRFGDLVGVRMIPVSAELTPQPELALPILYSDAWLVVVDKPAGMPSTALRSTDPNTVANFLAAMSPPCGDDSWNPLESGLVHRLDTDTSGVLIAARDIATYRNLRGQFSRGEARKTYAVVVAGDVRRPATIDWPIAHAPRHPRRMIVYRSGRLAHSRGARPAHTSYYPVERFGTATLLEVEITTGVRHQIRVHLASCKHPVLGDALYGKSAIVAAPAPRQLLHAQGLQVTHPATGRQIQFSAPLPREFAAILRALRRREPNGPRFPKKPLG
jgi:23S rRNA pseudouridine1911/1915/1917 synthase